jgi:S1-C subfamily serine protease
MPLPSRGPHFLSALLALCLFLAAGAFFLPTLACAESDGNTAVAALKAKADQGDAEARFQLGVRLYLGRDVPKDLAQAARLFEQAADQGHAAAQFYLGIFYYKGIGVIQDYVSSHKWFNLAASQGHSQAAELRDLVAGQMPPRQVAEAQSLARYWLGQRKKAQPAPELAGDSSEPPPPSADLVRKVQAALARLGHDVGRPDGVLGPRTAKAIALFQAKNKLPADGRPSQDLLDKLTLLVEAAQAGPPARAGTGTGFIVSPEGHFVTNYHVIQGAKAIRVMGVDKPSRLISFDPANDLALLKLPDTKGPMPAYARFRPVDQPVRMGEQVIVLGYPLRNVLAAGPNVTVGNVSALAGLRNDSRFLQFTAPIQNGNSGSPLLDAKGNVIGMVTSKMNALKAADKLGDIPQNVNFALHADVIKRFLESKNLYYSTEWYGLSQEVSDVVAQSRHLVLLIEKWQ